MRLRRQSEFQRVVKQGKRLVGRFLCLDWAPSKNPRLGISASTKYGSAVERNRFKRLVREAFRTVQGKLPPIDLHAIPRQGAKNAHFGDILEEFHRLIR